MKKLFMESWDAVMTSERNPLRHMDEASQHYFMQILAFMWSMVFSLSFLSIFHFHMVWGAHILVLGGIFFTVAIFHEGEKAGREIKPESARSSRE